MSNQVTSNSPSDSQESCQRVLIRAVVDEIPGAIERRPTTLWEQFCRSQLNRDSRLQEGFDIAHVPGGFDSQQHVKRWFLFDVGVTRTLSREEIVLLPHKAYRMTIIAQNQWMFEEHQVPEKSLVAMTKEYDWVCTTSESKDQP